MVEQYGTSILSILDSPSAATKLAKCRGIGSVNASTIKKDWDESRGRIAVFSLLDVMTSKVVLGSSVNEYLTTRSSYVIAGTRDARAFLKKLGVGGKLAQTLVDRYGVQTETRLRQDPYSTLFSIPGVSFRYSSPAAPLSFSLKVYRCTVTNSLMHPQKSRSSFLVLHLYLQGGRGSCTGSGGAIGSLVQGCHGLPAHTRACG